MTECNLFEELQEKKKNLLSLAMKAKEYGWIDSSTEKEIIDKINNDTLTIGVIGQMKCGKSTFLNSFVFEDDVLPAATTPMTAALSVITYGEQKQIEAEFYTADEWAEQKLQASRSLDEVAGNPLEESKVKAAKELVEKSYKLGSSLNNFLGKTQKDTFDNLIEYVGADGKYISITKSVTIYYPKEYLKGVEIVDTPGFNDPIVSREERTKAFLKKADVVLLMLYAGRPFDATDRDILFKNVGQCGTGRVLIGINKYDIPYENGETEDEIKDYVRDQLHKACVECNDNLLVEVLRSTEPIPLSAEMALLSELPMSKITSTDAYQHAWNRNCDNFEISNQKQMRIKSHIDDLIIAVKKVVENEKEEILIRKPLNAIVATGKKKKTDIEKDIQECNLLINTLGQSDDDIEEQQRAVSKAHKRLTKKIDSLGDDIDSTLRNIVRSGRNQLEDSIESACKRMDGIIEEKGMFNSGDAIVSRLKIEKDRLVSRTLRNDTESISDNAKEKMKSSISTFCNEVEDVLMRYIPDFDSRSFVKNIENELEISIDNQNLFSTDPENNDTGFLEFIEDSLNELARVFTLGLSKHLDNAFEHSKVKQELHEKVHKIRSVDVQRVLEPIFERKNEIINTVKSRFLSEMIEPLQEKLDEFIENADKREQELKNAQNKLEQLQQAKSVIDEQLSSMQ